MVEKLKIDAYHGTSATCATSILNTDHFIPSKHGWFGRGIYFFERDPQLAKEFAEINRISPICIIKSRISTTNDKILDMTVPNSKGCSEFHQERKYLIEKLITIDADAVASRKRYIDGNVIDILCKRRHYLLSRNLSYTYLKIDHDYKLSSRIPNGVELCIKDDSCIINKEVLM